MFYGNTNTKCFFNTLNIFYVYICVVFEFLILFVFILHKFLGYNHNGSYHRVDKCIGSP